ncbi:hypothetical protein M409DRAFT_68218 [Zasmidium cellare ATCC 36951]|uniref:6-methylsalicylate decarboxylase n=1 Tax=Zasmidium cellare ATCC 36951 TaxID=1080233 RepID=A0A6A6C9X0_ZASCE|nr:uncharacterized protein M409DRAFT_68218 [Zasmidium cellare ATCC 36951]KAF2163987.1 hypothetical protein M409DRAFT_68218 [Zasmidium cellare ATCC 36951]
MARSKIDMHAHFVPPVWREACLKADLGRPLAPWNENDHLAWMEKAGICKSIVGITDPGTHLVPGKDEEARKLTRECNEFAADLKRRNPEKFGFWASLPLPDVEGSLVEISHALDVLYADGVTMLTNHHRTYLGDPKFEPIFKELDRRGATVFIHPTLPREHSQMRFDAPSQNSFTAMMEFAFDETRTAVSLLLFGVIQRYTNIQFIFTHAGGVLPPLVERLIQFSKMLSMGGPDMSSASVRDLLRHRVLYDLSLFVFPDQIHGLLRIADPSQLLYGSDYPYVPETLAVELEQKIDKNLEEAVGGEENVERVLRSNAIRLPSRQK